jgi:hypothetical protein
MTDGNATLPTRREPDRLSSPLERLAKISKQEIWLSKQKSACSRQAYRLDAKHFMRTLSIATIEQSRQADQKGMIAWEYFTREVEHAAASTIRRRLAALSSLYKHPVRCDVPCSPYHGKSDRWRFVHSEFEDDAATIENVLASILLREN